MLEAKVPAPCDEFTLSVRYIISARDELVALAHQIIEAVFDFRFAGILPENGFGSRAKQLSSNTEVTH
jgi:hypothetical protein